MIIKKPPQKKSNMHLFFAYEAENDKDEKKDEITTIRPRNNVATDYSADIEEIQEQDNTSESDEADDGPTNYFSSGIPDDEPEPPEDDPVDETEPDGPQEYGEEDQPDDEESDVEDDDEATDYSMGEDEEPDYQQTDNMDSQPTQPPIEDQYKKYILYKDFLNLYNSNKLFISKLENITKDTIEANMVLKTVVSNLREVGDILFEYMTIKFMSSTYVQSLFFFKSTIATITLNFELLKNNDCFLN